MKTIEDLQKENKFLAATLDDHRNFLWHLRDSTNEKSITYFLNEYRFIETCIKNLKAQAIEEMVESIQWLDYERSIKNQILDYINDLRGEK